MKYKVSEFEGARLDAAVAMADGLPWQIASESDSPTGAELMMAHHGKGFYPWHPSRDWEDGGPIIERERIATVPLWDTTEEGELIQHWCAFVMPGEHHSYIDERASTADGRGPTPLVAAMRAFVHAKLGNEVELP